MLHYCVALIFDATQLRNLSITHSNIDSYVETIKKLEDYSCRLLENKVYKYI